MEKSLGKNNYYDGIENIINLETAVFCSKNTNKYIQTTINGKVYFGKKYTKFYSKIEVFVEELAKDYKIPCASCLFGFYQNTYYLLSESVYDDKVEFISLADLLLKEKINSIFALLLICGCSFLNFILIMKRTLWKIF